MPLHVESPLIESLPLGEQFGAPVFLKMESAQPTGSFKIRGVGAACEERVAQGARGLVSSSGGNAGYAVAYAGRHLGVPVTVVVPETTPQSMRARIAREGAQVLEHGASWDDAHAFAYELAGWERGAYIHPFDDPRLWSGHASLVEEAARTLDPPGAVVVAVGGGGLLCGVLEGMQRVGWQEVPVLAVETEGAESFARSVAAGELVTLEAITSIATTLGARRVAPKALEWVERHPVTPWIVADRAAVESCLRFADDHRTLVEPACGAALSAVYDRAEPLPRERAVLVVVCGGAGVDRDLLASWSEEVDLPTGGGISARAARR